MGDDRLNGFEVEIRGGRFIGQDISRVEDVEPLVLHSAEIEVAHRDDVEHAEIILAAIGFLVPAHRALQRVHRPGGARGVAPVDMDAEIDVFTGHRGEGIAQHVIFAGAEREEIGGLLVGVDPFRVMAPARKVARGARGAIGEEDREFVLRADHPYAEGTHHVRTVRIEGDAAEAFGLALGAEPPAREIETRQRGVGFR